MDRRRRSLFAVLIATIIVVAVFSSFAVHLFSKEEHQIRLPDLSEELNEDQPGTDTDGGQFVRVEVTPKTVQNIIAKTLSRPQSYYREITIELWAGELSSVTTARVWVDNGWTRSDVISPDGTTQHNLVGEDTRWLWYNQENLVRSFSADQTVADLIQRIPTYEDVLELSQSAITATGYEEYGGQRCVFVEVEQEELASRERYWISVSNGLLVAAERVKDDQVVYRMTALSMESPAPLSSSFALPDGTVLHAVGQSVD